MYFPFFKLHSWGKRSAVRRRRFIQRLLKQCFKVNFSAWLNEFRVEKAKEQLTATRLSVREGSLACGYADANYFARVFKRITGMTPSEYRANG